jgi:hypothetical protein
MRIDGIMIVVPVVILDFDEIKHITKTGEHLTTVIDRVEVRNHLTWAMDWKGERLGIVGNASALYQLFQRTILLKPTNKLSHPRSSRRVICSLR